MNIPDEALRRDYRRATAWWGSHFAIAAKAHGIPRLLLEAIGSRETNLGRHWRLVPPADFPPDPRQADLDLTYWARVAGDGGHGHGILQIDDRSHDIPATWRNDMAWQIGTGARVLADMHRRWPAWRDAIKAYNAGSPKRHDELGRDYGSDVLDRWSFLADEFPPVKEEPMEEWMPGVIHTPPHNQSGLSWIDGTAWKLVLHTTESNYRRSSGGRSNYHDHQSYPHFEVSEAAIEQYLPLSVGAYALAAGTSTYGYGNGAHAVQVEIVWNAANARNMNAELLDNLARVLTYVRRETGMDPTCPSQGFPERVSQGYWFRSPEEWYDFCGICGHGNVPGNFERWDPGPLPIDRIIAISDAELNPEPEEKENDMAGTFLVSHNGTAYITDGMYRQKIPGPPIFDELVRLGVPDRSQPPISDELLSRLQDVRMSFNWLGRAAGVTLGEKDPGAVRP